MSDEAPVEEPNGYAAVPGFVKSQVENNDYYIEQFKNDPWYVIIKHTHESLTELVPGYNIAQIKEKFGGLRYYIDFPDGVLEAAVKPEWRSRDTVDKVHNAADNIIRYAEAWVDGYEAAKREAKNND